MVAMGVCVSAGVVHALRGSLLFFFNDTATTEIYTLSLHDALPIYPAWFPSGKKIAYAIAGTSGIEVLTLDASGKVTRTTRRSEEHTSELQSRQYLVCRLLLEKKKYKLFASASCIRHSSLSAFIA